jgi:chemotaxis protein MotB
MTERPQRLDSFSIPESTSPKSLKPPPRPSHSSSKTLRGAARKVRIILLASGFSAAVLGCVREEPHQEALTDLQRIRLEHWSLKTRLLALDHEAALLRMRMQDRDRRMTEATLVQSELMKRLDEATVINAELSERLRKAGQSVKDLSGERSELSRTLADTRTRLEELAKKQAAAEARLTQFKTLVEKFKRLSQENRARAIFRHGQMLVEIPTDQLFEAGKTQVTTAGRGTLVEVAKILKTMPSRKYQVAGHTDNVKLEKKTKFASNWELSTARAVEVTKVLVENGMDESSLSAGGFAEFTPAASNDTDEGRRKNRRIEIVLVPTAEEIVSMPGVQELGADVAPRQ